MCVSKYRLHLQFRFWNIYAFRKLKYGYLIIEVEHFFNSWHTYIIIFVHSTVSNGKSENISVSQTFVYARTVYTSKHLQMNLSKLCCLFCTNVRILSSLIIPNKNKTCLKYFPIFILGKYLSISTQTSFQQFKCALENKWSNIIWMPYCFEKLKRHLVLQ